MKGTEAATGAHSSRRIVAGSAISSAGTSGITTRRTNLRSSSGCGSTQRLSGGNRDHSVTQFALIDDENVSALQQVRNLLPREKTRPFNLIQSLVFHRHSFDCGQVTRGGALTLASQWKSQFDDSEETTDNEWKQEPQVSLVFFKLKKTNRQQ